MHNTDRDATDRRLARAERTLAAIAGVLIALLGVYALGASGVPGDAFVALIDWVVDRGLVSVEASDVPAAALTWIH